MIVKKRFSGSKRTQNQVQQKENAARKWTEQKRKKNTSTIKCPYEWRQRQFTKFNIEQIQTHTNGERKRNENEIIRQESKSSKEKCFSFLIIKRNEKERKFLFF